MKMIFFGEAAKDSGSFGFSEACPLIQMSMEILPGVVCHLTILPILHGRPFVLQHPRSTPRWRSCCCLCRLELPHTDLPYGYNPHSPADLQV